MKIKRFPGLEGLEWKIYSVCDEQGVSEVEQLFTGGILCKKDDLSRLLYMLDRVSKVGPSTFPKDICHDFGDGLWQFTAHSIRLMWFYDEGKVVVCTHGFVKKRAKTNNSEINKAKSIKKEYFSRRFSGTLTKIED